MTTIKLLSATLLALSATAVFADEPAAPAAGVETTPATASVQSCAQETGSRIPGSRADCMSGSHVKTYDRGYLLSGSSMDSPAGILRSDPAIIIHHR